MSDRITQANVETRCESLNRRMESRDSIIRYEIQGRNGGVGLDRMRVERQGQNGERWITEATVTFGTKREVAEFLHAMMVALDDSAMKATGGTA